MQIHQIRRRLKALVPLICAAAMGACGGGQGEMTELLMPPGGVMLAVGDSLTSGYTLGPRGAWPAEVERARDIFVINAARNGATSADLLSDIDDLLSAHEPDIVVITIGGNDILRRVPQATARQNIREIARRIVASNAKVLLLSLPSTIGSGTHRLYRGVLNDIEGAYMDEAAMHGVFGKDALMADQIHPNEAGHFQIAQRVLEWVKVAPGLTQGSAAGITRALAANNG